VALAVNYNPVISIDSLVITRAGRHYFRVNPRHSLVSGIIWLVVALAASFAVAASIWAGGVAREIVVQQHVRRLALETDQLSSDLTQAVGARLAAVKSVSARTALPDLFRQLVDAYPDLGWIALADAGGNLVAGDRAINGDPVSAQPWFAKGREDIWLGVIDNGRSASATPLLGDLAAPVLDAAGRVVGVIAAHLNWHWASLDVQRLSTSLDPRGSARTLILDGHGAAVGPPQFERLPDGRSVLVARSPLIFLGAAHGNWLVQLSEPKELVYLRADALAIRILWISICLGAATAALGALGARQLMHRLKALTRSAVAVGRNETMRIEVPSGRDEVAQLGNAFAAILDALHQERGELLKLSGELERRVAVRTGEVERLAEESRYAAIVRERLQIARDLHDTLAHSMMAMLSEVRLLRKIHLHDPGSLAGELARAEQVAQSGLNEARAAIAQMRHSSVRDTGIGPSLSKSVERFIDRTGLEVEFRADPQAARFGDERAEVLLRMAEEALRNIERHAGAARVSILLTSIDAARLQLEIKDYGVGFDTHAARPGHFGLLGLREQAQLINAVLDIESAPDQGTTVTITLRVTPEIL
jgi:signal transduction histidine kinase